MKLRNLLFLLSYFISPSLFAQWQECPTPYHGSIVDLQEFDGYMWAATDEGGVYRYSISDTVWHRNMNGCTSYFDNKGYVFRIINNELYYGSRGGLYKRTSATSSWTQLRDLYHPSYCLTGNSNVIIQGCYGEVSRSTDDGITWTLCTSGLPTTGFNPTHLEENSLYGEIYLSVDFQGVYHSTDQGLSWTLMPMPSTMISWPNVNMLKRIGNTLYAGFDGYGLYEWSPTAYDWIIVSYTGSRVEDLLISNNQYVINSPYGLYTAPISGGSFFYAGTYNAYLPVTNCIERMGNKIFIGCREEGAMIIDTSIQNYSLQNTNLKAASNTLLSGNGSRLIASFKDQYATWISDNEFDTAQRAITPQFYLDNIVADYSNNQGWYIIASGKGVLFSSDNGLHFRQANTGLPSTFLSYNISSICQAPNGKLILGSRDGKFYQSTNDTTWSAAGDLFSGNENIVHLISAGNYLFAGTQDALNPGRLYRSGDNGITWQALTGPFQFGRDVFGLAYDGNRIIAGSGGYGTFASYDLGLTWDTINDGLPSIYVLPKIKFFNGALYGVEQLTGKLYKLLPQNTTWQCVSCNSNLSVNNVYYQGTTLFVGTSNNGIWKWPLYSTGIEQYNFTAAEILNNPSKSPQIKFNNEIHFPVNIEVYDPIGKIIFKQTIASNIATYSIPENNYLSGIYSISITDSKCKHGIIRWLRP